MADSDHFHGNEALVTRSVRLALERLPSADLVEQAQLLKPSELH